jgi:IstB-like ATP binding protein
MNERSMRHLGLSRRELFEKIERNALTPLPEEEWEFAEWRRARVNLDYHIEVHDFLYSVPHALIRAEVEVRVTARAIEVFLRGQRIEVHERRYMGRKHGTTLRRQKQFETRARVAKLRHLASVEDVDYQTPRGLDRALFLKLAACDWIAERRNLIWSGKPR